MKSRARLLLVSGLAATALAAPAVAHAGDPLCGEYQLIADSDGTRPTAGSTITLTLASGKATIVAARPGKTVRDRGTYRLHSRHRITVRFAEMSFRASKRRYSLSGDELTLPFKVLDEGRGSSTWRRIRGCGGGGRGGDDGGDGGGGGGDGSRDGDDGGGGDDSDDGARDGGGGGGGSGGPRGKQYGEPGTQPKHFVDAPRNAGKGSELADYVGHWAGMGWGWEIRFKESRKAFANQLFRGKNDALGLSKKGKDGTLMSLTVEHAVRFAFSVDAAGTVKGRGQITYYLYPNLCGVAALARMVNDQIDFLKKLPEIYELGTQIGTSLLKRFNADWLAEETKLAGMVDDFRKASPKELMQTYWAPSRSGQYNVAINDARGIGQAVVNNVCSNYNNFRVVGGMDCASFITSIGGSRPTKLLAAEEIEKVIYDAVKGPLLDRLKQTATGEVQETGLETKQKEMLCTLAPETFSGGKKIGPSNLEEFLLDQAGKIPDIYSALKDKKLPVDFLLDIPGMTKVQYYYKGLADGPETRTFELSGELQMTAAGPRLFLEVGKVSGGPEKLFVEWMVNYKKEKASFPTWSPFLAGPGYVRESGARSNYQRTVDILKKKITNPKTGKKETMKYRRKRTHVTSSHQDTPFATFFEKGTHRNKVKVWHDYEYYWSAYKVTEPIDDARPSGGDEFGLE